MATSIVGAAAPDSAAVLTFPARPRARRRAPVEVKKTDRAHLLHLLRLEDMQRTIDHHEERAASFRREMESGISTLNHPKARWYSLSYAAQAAQHAWLAEDARLKLAAVEAEYQGGAA